MIPRAGVTAWRAKAPWSTDAQVEQDLALSRVAIEVFGDAFLSAELAFRGGTALSKLYFDRPLRYSEDLDLVQTRAGPIGSVLKAIRSHLDPWLGRPRAGRGKINASLTYAFDSEIAPITRLRLKIEINGREHFSVLGLKERPLVVESAWFTGRAKVVTYELEELLGTKLRALYQRKKGRDLFDLAMAFKAFPNLDRTKVIKCFLQYLHHQGLSVTRSEFEKNLAAKAADPAFTEDILPLLAPIPAAYDTNAAWDISYWDKGNPPTFNAAAALEQVREAFLSLLT